MKKADLLRLIEASYLDDVVEEIAGDLATGP
jgi:hypothetical protein